MFTLYKQGLAIEGLSEWPLPGVDVKAQLVRSNKAL